MSGVRTIFLISLMFLATIGLNTFGESKSCECPKVSCPPCQDQSGLTFYSEKCGDGSEVMSCAKPTCVDMDPLPASCRQASKKTEMQTSRHTASVDEPKAIEVGKLKDFKGSVWRLHQGKKKIMKNGELVRESDTILTGENSRARIVFSDSNELLLSPNSKINIYEYRSNAAGSGRSLMKLIRGKVRSSVKKKYNGKTTYFKIKTRTATAGVRGTDFVVSYFYNHKQVTQVQTLEGEVELNDVNEDRESLKIAEGEQASFVVDTPSSGVFSDEEIANFVAKGYMTPVYKMTAKELAALDSETGMTEKARSLASQDDKQPVCLKPDGDLNDCLWICKNNPKGSNSCRSDLADVSCIRKRCNANGDWAEDTRLPASSSHACPARGHKIKACDY